MWYFTWILGLGFAVAVAIISAITLETNYAFGQRDEDMTRQRFESARQRSR
jgi:cyd operon protein YbgT